MALYPVPANGYGGINQNLFPFKVTKEMFKEWVQNTPLNPFMGQGFNNPIVTKYLNEGEGYQYRVGQLQALDYTSPVMDFEQAEGTSFQQSVKYDSVTLANRGFSIRIYGDEILKQGAPFKLSEETSSQLKDVFSQNLSYEVFKSMTNGAYPVLTTANCNVPGTLPSYDRVVMPGGAANSSVKPTRAAYHAGALFGTLLDNFQTPATTSPAGTGLSVKLIDQCRNLATIGFERDAANLSRDYQESPIRPCKVMTNHGVWSNKYVLLIDPRCYDSLRADPQFKDAGYGRGVISSPNQPQIIDNGNYVGSILNVEIFLCQELVQKSFRSADGNKNIAWNVLMGGSAHSLGWAKTPHFGVKYDDFKQENTFYGRDFRGHKMLQFASNYNTNPAKVAGTPTTVEQGVIHLFASF